MNLDCPNGLIEPKKKERGQVLVLFVLMLTVLIGFVSLAIDVGLFMHEQQNLQNVVDASALAAAQELPDNGAAAETIAQQYALANDTSVGAADLDVTFRCMVGDRNEDGAPDPGDIPAVCDPGGGASWSCSGETCVASCTYVGSNSCNVIVVGASKNVPFFFGPALSVIGGDVCFVNECSTGDIRAAACRGACGLPPSEPLDAVITLDRTGSMSATELANAKNGANAALTVFNREVQYVGLAVLGPSDPANECNSIAGGNWLPVPMGNDYQNADGSLNSSSEIVSRINCLNTSAVGTNLGDPAKASKDHLNSAGRVDVTHGMIFMTDGEANAWTATNTGLLACGANVAVSSSSGDNNGFQTTPGNACANGGGTAQDASSGTNTNTSCGDSGKDRHIFYNYGIAAPTPGQSPLGIEVRLDGYISSTTSTTTRRFCVELSWDGGTSWTASKQTSNITTSEQTYSLGNSTDNWGHAWTDTELNNTNFRVRVTMVASNTSRTFFLDYAAVRAFFPPSGSAALGPCDYAVEQGTIAKSQDPPIVIYTIGFGLEGLTCQDELSGSSWAGDSATSVLAAMATESEDDGGDGAGGIGPGCDTAAERTSENADGDHFLCEATSGDLAPIFTTAAEGFAENARLIQLPD